MVLATHAIVGASVANILPSHLVLGFAVGFLSHFILDSIHHFDYDLLSQKKDLDNPMNSDLVLNKKFLIDLFRVAVDCILGFSIVLLLFGFSNLDSFNSALVWMPLWGAIGGVTPDLLQFVYFKWRHQPLVALQKFHVGIQKHVWDRPVLGISTQVIIAAIAVIISKLIN